MMASILNLPAEILLDIFQRLPAIATSNFEGRGGGLTSICLVNRRFNALASPLLYETVELGYWASGHGNEREDVDSCLQEGCPTGQARYQNVKFVRNLIFYKSECTRKSNYIRRRHGYDMIEHIMRDQLLSLSVTGEGIGDNKWLTQPQTNLRELCLDHAAIMLLSSEIFQMIGLGNISLWPMDPAFPQDWNQTIRSFASTKTRLEKLTMKGLDNGLSFLMLICLVYTSHRSLRSLEVGFDVELFDGLQEGMDLSHHISDFLHDSVKRNLPGYGVNLDLYEIPPLDLEELIIRDFHWWETVARRGVHRLLNLEKLTRLILVDCALSGSILPMILPYTTHLTDLRWVSQEWKISLEHIALLPSKLRVLQLLQPDSGPYIGKKFLEPHRDTLEVLWLDKRSPGHILSISPLSDYSIDWYSIAEGWFPNLKEVAVPFLPTLVPSGNLISSAESRIRIVRFLNIGDFARRGSRSDMIKDIVSRNMKSEGNSSALKMLSFSEIKSNIHVHDALESEAYIMQPEEFGMDPSVLPKMNNRDAESFYPDLEVLRMDKYLYT